MGKQEENKLKIKREREGTTSVNKHGHVCEVLEYHNYENVIIKVPSGYQYRVSWKQVVEGSFKDPYAPLVYGVGYHGVGKYDSKRGSKSQKIHKVWNDVLKRCYSPLEQARYPTYKGCETDPRWYCYQDFAEWYVKQDGAFRPKWAVDKDLIAKGNKIYGPDTCFILPPEVNGFLMGTHRANKDKDALPVGVTVPQYGGGYISAFMYRQSNGKSGRRYFGKFDTPEGAFIPFKQAKEEKAKMLANKYKDELSPVAYDLLMKWEITLDD